MQLALETMSPRDRLFQSDQSRHGCTVEPCPRCGSRDIWPEFSGSPYGLYCRGCQWGGPRASAADGDPDEAIAAWNEEGRKVAQARELGLSLNLVQPVENPDE